MNLDEIGPWSEIKLDILRDYAAPYSTILKSNSFHHGYIVSVKGGAGGALGRVATRLEQKQNARWAARAPA